MSYDNKDLKNISMIVSSNFKIDDIDSSKILIDTIEKSISSVIECVINKTTLSEKDKSELDTIFSNVRKKTLL
jgi:hypothetical protein